MGAYRIFKKGHFGQSFTQKYLKITIFGKKKPLFCQILQGAVSNYRTLISFGLFLIFIHFTCRIPEILQKIINK